MNYRQKRAVGWCIWTTGGCAVVECRGLIKWMKSIFMSYECSSLLWFDHGFNRGSGAHQSRWISRSKPFVTCACLFMSMCVWTMRMCVCMWEVVLIMCKLHKIAFCLNRNEENTKAIKIYKVGKSISIFWSRCELPRNSSARNLVLKIFEIGFAYPQRNAVKKSRS